ncbi:hypothetical protein [uncultured Pontibacter sp.]|uniref:hypothetical protein n=1 Tax=uncultured Pontibacter sp. TaxID=453356 RepID=UPI002608E577|nr:hypothetical protein [uncultured Pontibacter sp.]
MKFNPFNPYKRLQVYANATLAPVIGHIKATGTESLEGETSEIYNEEHASVNVVATAGLTANYKMSECLDIFADGMFLYRSLHNRGALLHHKPMSVGVGLNYNLNLKREK